jgi:phosphate transport system substrate-binding protein
MRGPTQRLRTFGLAATITAAGLLASVCGGDLVELRINGSSTVYPIAELAVIDFAGVDNTIDATVGFVGTGGGGERFCRGEIEIWTASRTARPSDIDGGCEAAGVSSMDDLVEFEVGIDALSVVVNPENSWAQCMTVEQVNLAFREGGAERWSDIDPEWPDREIVFYYPGTDSGTYDYFLEAIIDEVEGTTHRTDGTSSEDDNVLALGVEQDRNALGYLGYAYYQQATQSVNAVAIDGGEGCVEPTPETAVAGDYQPLSRPLYMYSSEDILGQAPQAVAFLSFLYANMDIVADAGYITLPEDVVTEQVAKLEPYRTVGATSARPKVGGATDELLFRLAPRRYPDENEALWR